ncbi:MAG TPA: hypothetical protein DCG72_11185 [Gammaproteobacteria bacterium]|nr:hypothetical protein [Gammaproteobacteria bacterium]
MLARIENDTIAERRDITMADVPVHKQANWRPLVVDKPAFDGRLYTETGPTVTITADEARETWTLTAKPLDVVKAVFHSAVDDDAEQIRLKYVTPGDGMMMTYREKLEQAEQAVAQGQAAIDALTTEEETAAYPTLSASVGIEAATLWDCAQLVLTTYQQWAVLSNAIEKTRLAGKKAISDAGNVDDVKTAYDAINWGAL